MGQHFFSKSYYSFSVLSRKIGRDRTKRTEPFSMPPRWNRTENKEKADDRMGTVLVLFAKRFRNISVWLRR